MRIRKKTEPDLYVVNKPFSESEKDELSLIIANYKKKRKIKYPKLKPAAGIREVKKYQAFKTSIAFFREPEPDLYVINKPFTETEKKELSKVIRVEKKQRKLPAKQKPALKKAKTKA